MPRYRHPEGQEIPQPEPEPDDDPEAPTPARDPEQPYGPAVGRWLGWGR